MDNTEIDREVFWNDDIPLWIKNKKLFVPPEQRKRVMYWFHISRFGGHGGINKTLRKIKRVLGWPNMANDVREFVNKCLICNMWQAKKYSDSTRLSLEKLDLFEMISIDFIGPRQWFNKAMYVQVIIDHYSRFMATEVLETTPTTTDVINMLSINWLPKFGVPRAVLTDCGSQFVNATFRKFIEEKLGSKLIHTSPYYPQGNGINEVSHKMLEFCIKSFANTLEKNSFVQVVADATMIYNASPHTTIGNTPSDLVFGQDMLLPGFVDITPVTTEEERAHKRKDRKIMNMAIKWLNEITYSETDTEYVKVGDIVSYQLSDYEKTNIEHISGANTYGFTWSLPYRVTKVKKGSVFAIPLWHQGKEKQIPFCKIRLLGSYTPLIMKQIIKQIVKLNPKMNWRKQLPEKVVEDVEIDDSNTKAVFKDNKRLRT